MQRWMHLLTAAAVFSCAVAASDVWAAPASSIQTGAPATAITLAPAKNNAKLIVTSSSFSNNAVISDTFSQNGQNQSPQLSWTAGPAGTQSYVVLAEDTSVQRPQPIDHWVVYDIPASVTSLPQGLPKDTKLLNPSGALQGMNVAKAAGYTGPKPPAGQTHTYHFQVFALDTKLNLDPAKADRTSVVNAMKDHVLASGEVVGSYTGR